MTITNSRNSNGLNRIANLLPNVAGHILGKKGFNLGKIALNWSAIVGDDIAKHTFPLKLTFPPKKTADAVLHIKCHSLFALELTHQQTQVIEKINTFLGYKAVSRLKIIQFNK